MTTAQEGEPQHGVRQGQVEPLRPGRTGVLLLEIGKDRYETMKVQIYKDGHTDWATAASETGKAFPAEAPFPSIAEIASQPDIQAWEVTRQTFEFTWVRATSSASTLKPGQ
ncbi:DUF6881 domain-containing protein [Nocardia nova]|uniref:DUF6881 domain-containing protein n=1 Tax=Nocardia nova TaxID=37330 RepID=UPI0034E86749